MMERFRYERLEVVGDEVAEFDPVDEAALALAVERLGQVAPGKLAWLRASLTLALGPTHVPVSSLLTYAQVQNKTETEIWQMLDANTEKHIETVKKSRRSFHAFEV